MGIERLVKAIISRALPQAGLDTTEQPLRIGRYQDLYTIGVIRKQHALADEGSYFVANNAGTGVATAAAPTAFSDTAPLLTIFNTDSPSNLNAKRIHLDVLRLVCTAAGTAGTNVQLQIKLDNANRYASGGQQLTPLCPNMDVGKSASISDVRFLPVATAASVNARTVVGAAPILSHALAIGDMAVANFGGVEGFIGTAGALGGAGLPPIIIGPGQCALINFLILTQSAASSWTPELGIWER